MYLTETMYMGWEGLCSWVWSSGAAEQSIEIMEMDAANPLSVSRADIDPLTQE